MLPFQAKSASRTTSSGRPARRQLSLVAWAFRCCLSCGHFPTHLGLDCVEVEACATLHRRVVEEGLDFFTDYLLDEDEAPELILKPIEILLGSIFRTIAWPAGAFERIEAQVGDVGDVRVGFFAEPALGLVDETEFIVIDAHRANGTLAEIEDFMPCGRTFAGDGGRLVVAIKMVFIGPPIVLPFSSSWVMLGLPAAATKVGSQSIPEKMPFCTESVGT